MQAARAAQGGMPKARRGRMRGKTVMAISGHATSKELLRYTKAADQIRLAQAAMAKMINQITGAEFIHRGDESTFTAQLG